MSAKERFASSLEANSELSAEHAPGDVHESLWRNPPEIQRPVRNEFCIEHTSHIHPVSLAAPHLTALAAHFSFGRRVDKLQACRCSAQESR